MNLDKSIYSYSVWAVVLLCSANSVMAEESPRVYVKKSASGYELIRNGNPYRIRGVGGTEHLGMLSEFGGNSIRTWDTENLGALLDEAEELGLSVCAGLWLGHQRHGFDYQDQTAVLEQLDRHLEAVKKYRDHPALLMWGVGNEMEGVGTDPSVWYAVNHLAREIKELDGNHPTITVIAEIGEGASKVKSIERFCPDVDIVGLNSYGGIGDIGDRYRAAGGSKPYVVTEHGTLGPWECGKTSWEAPIEFTSSEKGEWYTNGYKMNAVKHADLCLGTYAFIWGHKQETTATWFGMLLPDGTRLAAVDAMAELWTGKAPENRCPTIESMNMERPAIFKPGASFVASVDASDPDGDSLRYEWVLRSDSGTIGEGGDPQENETDFESAVAAKGNSAEIKLPEGGGGYRLFATVYDDHGGAAVANVPLLVRAPIRLETVMAKSALPYSVYGDNAKNSVFIPSGFMGNAGAITHVLDCRTQPYKGDTCLKASYGANASWGGVLWQSPAGDWDGEKPGGANLTGATRLEFWARGENGGEVVNFVFGVLDGNLRYRDTAKGELNKVTLGDEWKRYSFDLQGLDLRQIKTGFGWSVEGQRKPVTFYLDEIQYVSE
ncbi:MAG: glycoside hydrolase family 2 TIM barrel-domain containing protein [Aureliella sp.]